mmetsp:Transcript_66255/g.145312  ORF Transcript_66255/g.145312 Transcript_66255/m.145312 type:complete len:204 (+) Transcript_66255:51-662(+)
MAAKEFASAMNLFFVRRRAEASKEGVHLSFPMLRQAWSELGDEERSIYQEEVKNHAKGSAFDAKQRLLQQQAQQELRKAEVKRTPSRYSPRSKRPKSSLATSSPLPTPRFPPQRRPGPEALSEALNALRKVAKSDENLPPPADLRCVAQRLLGPRLSFDWTSDEERELEVVPDKDQDVRKLLREELERSVSVQQAQRWLAEST